MNKISDSGVEVEGVRIPLPPVSMVIAKEGKWYVSSCPELGIASQGSNREEARQMLAEAVILWLKYASATEIKRQLARGARVMPLELIAKRRRRSPRHGWRKRIWHMPKLRPLSAKEVCDILADHGFVKVRQAGSHMVMRLELEGHDSRTVIVPKHAEIAKGTLTSIIKQSGLDTALFRK